MKNTSRMSSSVSAISLSIPLLMKASTSNSSLFKYAKLNMVEGTDTDFGDIDGNSSNMEGTMKLMKMSLTFKMLVKV